MVSHKSLSDSKSPQVYRTLSILTDLNNAIVWMISTYHLISNSSSLFTNYMGTVPRAPLVVPPLPSCSIFFSSLVCLRTYQSFPFLLFSLRGSSGRLSPTFCRFSFFLLNINRSGGLAEIRWSFSKSKSQRSLHVSFSSMDSELCIYYVFPWGNFNFLHNSQSCPVLYTFCVNLLHSLIIWLIVSSLSQCELH